MYFNLFFREATLLTKCGSSRIDMEQMFMIATYEKTLNEIKNEGQYPGLWGASVCLGDEDC